jgi:hypothetical protein
MNLDVLRELEVFGDFRCVVPLADEPVIRFPGLICHSLLLSRAVFWVDYCGNFPSQPCHAALCKETVFGAWTALI